jgi:SLOG in TRPM, prokaryote
VLPVLDACAAIVVDGGTDSGVMRAVGRARSASAAGFPLVGVMAEGTLAVAGREPARADAAELEGHHTHVLLVPGGSWGDETPWMGAVADVAAGALPSVTVLANGGEIAYRDVFDSLARRRPVVVLAGTGRTADVIAEAVAGRSADPRATEIAASPLTSVVAMDDVEAVRKTLTEALTHPSRTTLW